jgi:predicted transcriptional regulator
MTFSPETLVDPPGIRLSRTRNCRIVGVYRNRPELAEFGVIEFVTGGTRKRPILRAGTECIDFFGQFGRVDDSATTEAPDG